MDDEGIKVKTISGTILTLDNIELSDTIEKVKKKIEETQGFPPDTQILIFAGKVLEDTKTLNSYQFRKNYTLHLICQEEKMQIFVKTLTGKTITLLVDPNEKIDDIKKKNRK